jgi:hypothetical protein
MFPGDKDGRRVGLTTLPPSCANCLEIWEPQPPGTLRACFRLLIELLYSVGYKSVSLQILRTDNTTFLLHVMYRQRHTLNYTYIYTRLIRYLICILNFMFPAWRPSFAEFGHSSKCMSRPTLVYISLNKMKFFRKQL